MKQTPIYINIIQLFILNVNKKREKLAEILQVSSKFILRQLPCLRSTNPRYKTEC